MHTFPPLATAAAALSLALGSAAAAQTPAALTHYSVDPDASHLYIVTHKAGLLGFLGHEHALVPTEWRAELCLADPVPSGARGSVVVRTASLVIDTDSARALAGMDEGPGDEDRAEMQSKMLGPDHLHADSFPEVRLELRAPEAGEEDEVRTEGTLSLHGVTRDVGPVTLDVQRLDGGVLELAGQLRIEMRDYGIEPESVAGVVKVANEVDLHVRLLARPGVGSCDPA